MSGITSVTLTDSGERYFAPPVITVSLPDADSANATAQLRMNPDGTIGSVELIDSGAYYTTAPSARITYKRLDSEFSDLSFDSNEPRSYSLRLKNIDSTGYDISDYKKSTATGSANFMFYVKDSGDHMILGRETDIITLNDGSHPDDLLLKLSTYRTSTDLKLMITSDQTSETVTESLVHDDWNHIRVWQSGSQLTAYNGNSGVSINHFTHIGRANSGQKFHFYDDSIGDQDAFRVDTFHVSSNLVVSRANIGDSNSATCQLIRFDSARGIATTVTTTTTLTESKVSSVAIPSGVLHVGSLDSAFSGTPSEKRATILIDSATGNKGSFRARLRANIDSDTMKISSIDIIDSGDLYYNPPTITIANPGGLVDFEVGDRVKQTLSDGTILRGEVMAFSDSDATLNVGHVGASDGKYHSFATGRAIDTFNSDGSATANVTAVKEIDNTSNFEQNDDFETEAADFLDFTESNPFGEPS